jgi:hypothetical protein
MMNFKKYLIVCSAAALLMGNYACKKAADAVPVPSGVPGIIIAQPDGTDIAQGADAKFDMTITSISDLRKLTISRNVEGTTTWTVVKDSSFPGGQHNPQFNYFYTVPDHEDVGEKLNFKFSLSNANDTKVVTSFITVKESVPGLDVSQDKTSISLGDSVKFTIIANSSVAITELKATESGTSLLNNKYTVAQNKQSFLTYYSYRPTTKGLKTLTFTLTNKNNTVVTKMATVTVN